jgi:DNA-directed RNA polymerase II subunit RPB1
MTIRGVISAVTRHAMNKSSAGPLSKCTFEQSVDILLEAAKDGAKDDITGVSEKIMMGQIVKAGTGMVHILTNPVKGTFDPMRPSYLNAS